MSAHMENLLNINNVRIFDVKIALRKLYNDVEIHNRNLKLYMLKLSHTVVFLFITIIDSLVMIIARKFGENMGTLGLILKYLDEELIAKELSLPDTGKGPDNKKSSRNRSVRKRTDR